MKTNLNKVYSKLPGKKIELNKISDLDNSILDAEEIFNEFFDLFDRYEAEHDNRTEELSQLVTRFEDLDSAAYMELTKLDQDFRDLGASSEVLDSRNERILELRENAKRVFGVAAQTFNI